jgi:hypothetical protein
MMGADKAWQNDLASAIHRVGFREALLHLRGAANGYNGFTFSDHGAIPDDAIVRA